MTHFGYFTVDLFDCPPFKMFSNGDEPRSVNILEHKRFEPHSMKLWCRLVPSASSILDLGAHTGVYTLAAAALRKDVEIHAFEPNPFTGARLRVNKYVNAFDNIVEHYVGIADVNGYGPLSWQRKSGGWLSSGSQIGPLRGVAGPTIEQAAIIVATLDSFAIQGGSRPLMKIDVEGAEYNVFKGMPEFLKSRPAIILETFLPQACEYISAQLQDYRYFLIEEDAGRIVEKSALTACGLQDQDTNHILWPSERDVAEIL